MDETAERKRAALETLYASYDIVNRICRQGELPPARLGVSHRMSPNTMAYAQDRSPDPYRIVFNARVCRGLGDADLLQVMVHEMIHIWQFTCGRRGGHGKDFQDEQRRLGLVLGRVIPGTSPMGYVLFMHELKQLHPAEALDCLASHPQDRRLEADFFAQRARNLHADAYKRI